MNRRTNDANLSARNARLHQLMILVVRIGYSDQGDYYEVDAAGWEALQQAVERNIDPETIRLIRTAAIQ